ncbi:helix-turn-helix transcriptional regulator (plasmid) [Deinococcus radiomollis]|uniref:helix-turn-helix domain-containing protein n=1 Tax=Deinococcus radiomollis TaxID=468916 RepID=UPI003892877E
MRDIESELLQRIHDAMKKKGVTQSDFAKAYGKSRQAVNPYFAGRKSLLTETGKDLLEFLGVEIVLTEKET